MYGRLLAILYACGFPDVEAVLAKRDRAPADLRRGCSVEMRLPAVADGVGAGQLKAADLVFFR